MNKVLGIDDFFYVSDRSYDLTAEKALPHYHDAHKLLVSCLPFPREAIIEVIDLGVGSGVTAAYVLKNFPNARVTGVDLFPEMLDEARPRLKPFADRVTLVQSDNTKFLTSTETKVDAIVSAFCIHHQDEQGKKDLFAAIKKLLKPGGVFLMLDWTIFNSPHLHKIARENTMRHLEVSVTDAAYREKWAYHWNYINIPSSADDMVEWMNGLGLRAEIVFRDFEVALLSAATRCGDEKSSLEGI
jgi:tRNA (cmo5U34)-methyltransferase